MLKFLIFFLIYLTQINIGFSNSVYESDKIVAIVNEDILLKSDVCTLQNIFFMKKKNIQSEDNKNNLFNYFFSPLCPLKELVIRSIIFQLAKKKCIFVNEDEVNKIFHGYNIINKTDNSKISVDETLRYARIKNMIQKELIISQFIFDEIRKKFIILPEEIESTMKKICIQYDNETQFYLSYFSIKVPDVFSSNEDKKRIMINSLKKLIKIENGTFNIEYLLNKFSQKNNFMQKSFTKWCRIKEIPILIDLQNIKKGDIIGPVFFNSCFHIIKINNICVRNAEKMIEKFYVKHIFFQNSEEDIANIRNFNKLKNFYYLIKNGYLNFNVLTKKISEDLHSKNKDGILNYRSIYFLDPIFQYHIEKLKLKEISFPVHSNYGWHLIQLFDTCKIGYIDSVLEKKAYYFLYHKKFIEEMYLWIQEKISSSYINII
ncbi:Chaperone surA [Candidatus Westeberhardia cardiocondylae]|uniref:Chaperone surA n=1 Tax=Candidatus Westeberhardia cardiocondylae TaxID=1594731 RepID=A0A0H5BX45_9ENTR|nr:peptidylprolyl isomerase [Candidatus Westeberhardia cardiocondylae]CEN32345.1 Chaperone surA [Candidatus Westeberhardia cardiocondylae]